MHPGDKNVSMRGACWFTPFLELSSINFYVIACSSGQKKIERLKTLWAIIIEFGEFLACGTLVVDRVSAMQKRSIMIYNRCTFIVRIYGINRV